MRNACDHVNVVRSHCVAVNALLHVSQTTKLLQHRLQLHVGLPSVVCSRAGLKNRFDSALVVLTRNYKLVVLHRSRKLWFQRCTGYRFPVYDEALTAVVLGRLLVFERWHFFSSQIYTLAIELVS